MHRPATLGAMHEVRPLSHLGVTELRPVTLHIKVVISFLSKLFLYIKSNPGCLYVLSGKLRIFSFKHVFGNNFVSVPSKQAGLFNQIKLIIPLLVRTSGEDREEDCPEESFIPVKEGKAEGRVQN